MNDKAALFPEIPDNLPARLTAAQTAVLLGFREHDIPLLVATRFLKPLGDPPPYAVRYFWAEEILQFKSDRARVSKATNALYGNSARRNHPADLEEQNAKAA